MPRRTSINNTLKNLDVVILGGGLGTRLSGVINDRPKPMAEINQRPFLDILIEYVSGFGFKRFIICTGHMADAVERYFRNKQTPQEILFSREEVPLGTAGAVKNAQRYIQGNTFLVMNGDSFCPINIYDFFKFHLKKKALLSMAVTGTKSSGDYGSVMLDDSCRIVRFKEKEGKGKAFINAGAYIFQRDVLSCIPSQREYSLECGLFPELAGREFYGYITTERLIDIGTPRRYEKAKRLFREALCR